MAKQYIGTSGFSYPYWKNRFYPEKLAASKWLEYYATQFNSLEVNSSFYRFPLVKNLQKWASVTPGDFLFTVKAHKIITHTRRMKAVKDKVTEFMDIVQEGLGDKLGCVLYQLPPSHSFTEERLEDILQNIDNKPANVIEFRHESWWTDEVFATLKKHKLTIANASFPGLPDTSIKTSNVFYKRMHGVPQLFKSSYSDEVLAALAKAIPARGTSFVYFNNTMFEAGYENAGKLKELLDA